MTPWAKQAKTVSGRETDSRTGLARFDRGDLLQNKPRKYDTIRLATLKVYFFPPSPWTDR
jgi:hypothetical protein